MKKEKAEALLKEQRAKDAERKRQERLRIKMAPTTNQNLPNKGSKQEDQSVAISTSETDINDSSTTVIDSQLFTAPGFQLDAIIQKVCSSAGTHVNFSFSQQHTDNRTQHITNINGASQEDIDALKKVVQDQGTKLNDHEKDIGVLYTRTGRGKAEHDPRTEETKEKDFWSNVDQLVTIAGDNNSSPKKKQGYESDDETAFFTAGVRNMKDDESDAMVPEKIDTSSVKETFSPVNLEERLISSPVALLSWKEVAIVGVNKMVYKCLLNRDFDFALMNRLEHLKEFHPLKDLFLFGSAPYDYMDGKNCVTNCPTISILASDKGTMPLQRLWEPVKESQSEGILHSFDSVGLTWRLVSEGIYVLNLAPNQQEYVEYCDLWRPNTSRLDDGRLSINSVPIKWSVFEVDDFGDMVVDENGNNIPILDDDGENPLIIDTTWDRMTNSVADILNFYMFHLEVDHRQKYRKPLKSFVVQKLNSRRAEMENMIKDCEKECPGFDSVELVAKLFPLGVLVDNHGNIGYSNKFYNSTVNVFATFKCLSEMNEVPKTAKVEYDEMVTELDTLNTCLDTKNNVSEPKTAMIAENNEPIAFRTRYRCRK